MAGLFDGRMEYLDNIGPATVLLALGVVFLVGGFIVLPCVIPGIILLAVALIWGWATQPMKRHPETPWLSSPGAWCPTCGSPALWMPRDTRWFCNSCSRYLSTEVAPPAQPVWPPQ